ncbi:MAG: glycosyltransferase family 2 protein [Alicyclobacillaceae bacterium]|nr:glycosyltransferase family 2 protein [Alicyclobacillaceae bacterium]
MTGVRYSVVVPVFNEREVIAETYRRLRQVMDSLAAAEPSAQAEPASGYELLFVDDGSVDGTSDVLARFGQSDPHVRILRLSRNFGHQAAVSAGIDAARGDAVVIIDADLQDPPELIPELVDRWKQGYQVVYARRVQRQGETSFKRATAYLFYRLLRALTQLDIPLDAGDFRLLDRSVCDVLRRLREPNRFVRGLVAWSGFHQTGVPYVRQPRYAGRSKYSLKKMLQLASDAIVSFSTAPLKAPGYAGLAMAAGSAISLIALSAQDLWRPHRPAVAVLALLMVFCTGLVLIAIGMTGQYIARVHEQTLARPLYIVAADDKSEALDGTMAERNPARRAR